MIRKFFGFFFVVVGFLFDVLIECSALQNKEKLAHGVVPVAKVFLSEKVPFVSSSYLFLYQSAV